jgi:predicted adenylyl cyclase CyaB
MPSNLELKVRTDSFNKVKKILTLLEAKYEGLLNQKDVYYKNGSGLLKLRIENGRQSMIYYERNESSKNRWSNYEFLVFQDGNAESFLSKIFDVTAVVVKKRMLYLYDNTRIHLDEVKGLGKFIELETLVINGKADAKRRFDNTAKVLGIDVKEQIKKSYKDLIVKTKNQI